MCRLGRPGVTWPSCRPATLCKLIYGDAKRGLAPSVRVRPETAARIMAVRVEQAAGAQLVAAGPTWVLLDDLIARGYTRGFLATALGASKPALQVQRTKVRASTARKVEALHSRLVGQAAPGRRSRWSR